MKGKKKSTKQKNIYTRTYEERGACVPWGLAPAGMGTPGMGTGPRERCGSCSHTQCSHPGLGGQRGLPRVQQGQSKGLMHLGRGLTFTAPPSLPCRGPRAEPSAGGEQPAPTLGGEITAWGAAKVGGASPSSLP